MSKIPNGWELLEPSLAQPAWYETQEEAYKAVQKLNNAHPTVEFMYFYSKDAGKNGLYLILLKMDPYTAKQYAKYEEERREKALKNDRKKKPTKSKSKRKICGCKK